MGILLIISQSHLFSCVLFPFFIFLLFPHYPGNLWSTPLLIWFLCHWSSCILWFHSLLCDTSNTVIANKFNPIMCVVSFPTFTGFMSKDFWVHDGYEELFTSFFISVTRNHLFPFVIYASYTTFLQVHCFLPKPGIFRSGDFWKSYCFQWNTYIVDPYLVFLW